MPNIIMTDSFGHQWRSDLRSVSVRLKTKYFLPQRCSGKIEFFYVQNFRYTLQVIQDTARRTIANGRWLNFLKKISVSEIV